MVISTLLRRALPLPASRTSFRHLMSSFCPQQRQETLTNLTLKTFQLRSENTAKLAQEGAELLGHGGVVGVPTDTIYGIAGSAQNDAAIRKIYEIKGRNFEKPVAICVPSVEEIGKWGKVCVPSSLLDDLLPGPYTFVFERQAALNPNLNPGTDLIGIRVPDNQFILQLTAFHGSPIALTSANFSQAPSTLEVEEFRDLWPYLEAVFDGGRLAERSGSTVVDLSREGSFRVIREGSGFSELVKVLKDKYKLQEVTSE